MFDAGRAVEVLIGSTTAQTAHRGYGSGYIIGPGLVLTCGHIFSPAAPQESEPDDPGPPKNELADVLVRDIRGAMYPCCIEWLNNIDDLAILRILDPGALPNEPVVLAALPNITTGASLPFAMFGWPRAGDVKTGGRQVREPFEVNGEIRLSEFAAAKTSRMRLRTAEAFDPLLEGSSWTGMSGAAVICGQAVVAIQVSQPQPGLAAYLSGQPLTTEALSRTDAAGATALELLRAANVAAGVELTFPAVPDLAPKRKARASRPYLLLETGTVIGRDNERDEIEKSLAGAQESFRLLVGIGGIGKSALAWDVWERLKAGQPPTTRQFWYSFYDGRGVGNFDAMLGELSRFLNVEPPPETGSTAGHDHIADILQALDEHPTVLILDGLERCLRCYQRPLSFGDMEAVRADQTTDSAWNERDLGFANPDAYRLFASLLRKPGCRTIATSRVVPAELLSSGGAPRAGLRIEPLKGLNATGTAGLLAAFGIDMPREHAARIATNLGGHPLALSLLARRISRSTPARRDLLSWLKDQGFLRPDGPGPAELRQRLFATEISRLSNAARKSLAAAGAMGGLANSALLADVLGDEGADRLDAVLIELEDSGLATLTSERDVACHALISHVAFDALEPDASESLMRDLQDALAGRFKVIDGNGITGTSYFDWFTEHGTTDRIEAMALCKALVRLGQATEASDMYSEQLAMALRLSVAANIEAVALLEEIVDGLSPDEVRRHKADLAHHLTLVGRLDDATETLGDTTDTNAMGFRELMAASHLALLRGRLPEALRFSVAAVHRARTDLNYAFGYDYSAFQIMAGKDLVDLAAPCSDLIESACATIRALALDGWSAEAASIWVEAHALWERFHSQCNGCRGLLLRTGAELFLECGLPDLAQEALRSGARLQASQGKSLQGIFSPVLATRALGVRAALDEGVSRTLIDGGFVLYELIVESQTYSGHDDAQARVDAAIRSLTQIGCSLPPSPSQVVRGEDRTSFQLDAAQLAYATAWSSYGTFRSDRSSPSQALSEESDEFARVDGRCQEAMQRLVDQGYTEGSGDERALAASGDRRAATRMATRVELDLSRLPCSHDDETLDLETEGNIMRRRLELNPRDGHAILHLAAAGMIHDDVDECVARLRQFLYSTSTGIGNYQLAVDLAAQHEAVAKELVGVLRGYAYADHDPSAAYLALANLYWLLGDEAAALRTHNVGSVAPTGMEGPTHEYAHRCALFIFGEALERADGEPDSPTERPWDRENEDKDLNDDLDHGEGSNDTYYDERRARQARARRRGESVQRFFECVRDGVPYVTLTSTAVDEIADDSEAVDDRVQQEDFVRFMAEQCVRVVPLAERVRVAVEGLPPEDQRLE